MLALGAAMKHASKIDTSKRLFWFCLLVATAACLLAASGAKLTIADYPYILGTKIILAIGIVVLVALVRTSALGLMVAAFAMGFMSLTHPTTYGGDPWMPYASLSKRMNFLAAESVRAYQSLGLKSLPQFWIDLRNAETLSVPRSYLMCGEFAGSFPNLTKRNEGYDIYFPALNREMLYHRKYLVVLSTEGMRTSNLAKSALEKIGIRANVIYTHEIPISSVSMGVFEIRTRLE
jgi:hypothetical protein